MIRQIRKKARKLGLVGLLAASISLIPKQSDAQFQLGQPAMMLQYQKTGNSADYAAGAWLQQLDQGKEEVYQQQQMQKMLNEQTRQINANQQILEQQKQQPAIPIDQSQIIYYSRPKKDVPKYNSEGTQIFLWRRDINDIVVRTRLYDTTYKDQTGTLYIVEHDLDYFAEARFEEPEHFKEIVNLVMSSKDQYLKNELKRSYSLKRGKSISLE